jgi:cell fate (sporulation/competence/biofilm development) regulator YlbF (YheA/YmcA/DUF963 family)
MLDQTEQNAIVAKARELCQTILDQPTMASARQRVAAFLEDESARAQYESLLSQGQTLQQKQQSAVPLSQEEIANFESNREQLLKNPVARGFLDAQDQMHHVQHTVTRYLSKSLEAGRVPSVEEFAAEGCGHGCGCEH